MENLKPDQVQIKIMYPCQTCGGSHEIHNPLWKEYFDDLPKEVSMDTEKETEWARNWWDEHGIGEGGMNEPEFYPCDDCNEYGYTEKWITLEELKKLL